MYSEAIDVGVSLLAQYGLFVLLVAFVLEGALVGKLIPTRALFVAAVLAVGSDALGMASVALVAVAGATLGQLVLFAAVRYTDVARTRVPEPADPADPTTAGRFDCLYGQWGLSAVALTNALPVARGSLTVPVAMTDEHLLRFSASSLVGTSLYAVGLLVVAAGVEAVITLA